MHVSDLWEFIKKRLPFQRMDRHDSLPSFVRTDDAFEDVISKSLQLLNSCSVGTDLYLLSCLCPDDFHVILSLLRLDLGQPSPPRYVPKGHARYQSSYKDLLSQLRAYASFLPGEDYSRYWLELTQRWLLSFPVDSIGYKSDEASRDWSRRKLRSELVEWILGID